MAGSMLPPGMTQQSVDGGISNGGGNSTMFAAINMQSQSEQWSTRASYSSGVDGRSLNLSSAYSGSGDHASMLSAAHALTGAGIMQLTAAYNGKMSMDAINASGLSASGMAGFLRVPPVVKGILFLEDYRRRGLEYANKLAEDKAKATADPKGKSAARSATGGPNGQLPDGEDPEKKEKKYKINDDNADPSLPVGSRHTGQQPKYLTPNEPTNIGGRDYSGHALDRMRERGLLPTAVEDTIKKGVLRPAEEAGKSLYYNSTNNISVVTDTASGRVVTVRFGAL